MSDYISRQILKRKVLDRWENEGGRICADRKGIFESGSPVERASEDNAPQTSESPTADDPKEEEK
jgi:hypothetical protein